MTRDRLGKDRSGQGGLQQDGGKPPWTRPVLARLGTIADVAGTRKRAGDVIPGTHFNS